METILEGKQYLRKQFDKGTYCPCCGQFVKRYKRKFNSGMARIAIHIYKAFKEINPPEKHLHITHVMIQRKIDAGALEYRKLLFWNFLEEVPQDPHSDQKYSGHYTMTTKLELFVQNKLSIPKHIYIFDHKFLGYVDESNTINIEEALGNHFSYHELMAG